ncbi:MAG: glutamine synthetase family protein [Actinomycetota bacterium]|jgi:glutamine synthetase
MMGGVHGPADPERARWAASELADRGVTAVALTYVDNAGITRVKAVPAGRLVEACTAGVGMSPVFDVFLVDDSVTTSTYIGGPVGDLRLYPDLDALTRLAGQPGWAWAPADRYTQEGDPYMACQRLFADRMANEAAARGLELKMAFEVEWFVGRDNEDGRSPGDGTAPACVGPAYGMARVAELSDYIRDLLVVLEEQGVPVDQFHPEYAAGQLELSAAAADPVGAADRLVLLKETIRAVSLKHGLRVSFAPVVVAGQVGNGGHLHLSAWSEGRNLFTGGDGPYGLTDRGESILAGLLDALPALCAIGAPSVASYLRLVPQRWSAPWQCWGRENREAALRLVTGTAPVAATAANAELKCFDLSANPYLVVGAVTAIVAATADEDRRLPDEIAVDPAVLPPEEQPPRLPTSILSAVDCLEKDERLRAALGDPLFEAFVAVRRAEADLFDGWTDDEVADATRWRY